MLIGYPDSRGIATGGIGHTENAGPPVPVIGQEITLEEAMATFARDLRHFEDRIARLVKVPLSPNQFDALVSFDFNTGGLRYKSKRTGKLTDSQLLKAINGRKGTAAIKKGFLGWCLADNDPKALLGRRLREFALYSTGDYGAIATVPVSKVWPARYQQMALPPDAVEAEVPMPPPRPQPIDPASATDDEAADAASAAPSPPAYDPEEHGPAVPEPPKSLGQSKTIWGTITSTLSGGSAGFYLNSFFQNPHAVWIVVAFLVFLLIAGGAAAVVYRERLLKKLEHGI